MKRFLLFLFLATLTSLAFSQSTQTLKGVVFDGLINRPMEGVAVRIEGTEMGMVTDEQGKFKFEKVPVGRHQIRCDFLGYATFYSEDIILSSTKAVYLEIRMQESATELEEVTITALEHPKKALNLFSVTSTRSFSAEDTRLYATSVNDPGRMATSFPGAQVGGDEDENDIIIRGNSSFGMLWRLEGIDIPNPNHFARPGTSGGGITVFSAQLLSNSDFSTGAMPAEYGNAISGAFDMHFRKGNMDEREHRIRIGVLGLDFATEGPIKKGQSSYLVNYRYSTLGLLNKAGFELVGENVSNDFQDLSFNLAFHDPTLRHQVTVFGISGTSRERYRPREDTARWENRGHWEDRIRDSDMAAAGLTYTFLPDEKSSLKLVVAGMAGFVGRMDDTLSLEQIPTRVNTEEYLDTRMSASLKYSRKLSTGTHFQAGGFVNQIFYRFDRNRIPLGTDKFEILVDGSGNTQLLQGYAQLSHKMKNKLTLNAGLHAMALTLNGTGSIEPRLAMKYELSRRQTLSLAYGLHGQMLPLGAYFVNLEDSMGNVGPLNKDLKMIKSHHLVLSYNHVFGKKNDLRFQGELYFQRLFNVPVSIDPTRTFWMLNNQSGYAEEILVSEGTGMNYGFDAVLEKFFSNRFYFLLAGSVFESTYQALNGVTYNTKFANHYTSSVTAGKEFLVRKHNIFQIGIKALYKGGFRYTPADAEQSRQEGRFVPNDELSFSEQVEPYFRLDGRVEYRINRSEKFGMLFSLDVQNILNRGNTRSVGYDPGKDEFFFRYQGELIPVLTMQFDF